MAAPPGTGSGKKSGCGGKGIIIIVVLVVLFALVACAGAAAAAWYFDLVGMLFGGGRSVAYEHLPEGCEVVMNVDVQGLMDTPTVKKHVVPALDNAVEKDPDHDKMAAFFRSAQLNPKQDLHSVAVCVKSIGGSEPDVLVVVGGAIRPGKVIEAFDKHSDKDKFDKATTIDGMKVIEAKDEPVMIAQADDGAILLSNQKSLLKKGAESSSAWKKYDIPLSEQVGLVMTEDAAKAVNDMAGPRNPLGNSASGIRRGEASLSLNTGKLALKLDLASDGDAKDLADSVEQLLKMAKDGPAMGRDEKDLVGSIELKTEGKSVAITATIPEKMIEEAAKEIAEDMDEAGEAI